MYQYRTMSANTALSTTAASVADTSAAPSPRNDQAEMHRVSADAEETFGHELAGLLERVDIGADAIVLAHC